ncbi:MAG: hypothetical protein JNJ47_02345 [Alphaproteobacteria bacterium]|nr:hypothetical protein [Alphaproteobacteria bacterium]
MKKTFLFFVGMLFMSFSNPPPTNATFTDFTGLSLDDVRQNHQRLKQSVDNCYKEAKKHFAKIDEPWSNLCAVGVRWVIQTENNRLITDFDIIKDSNKKLLISSNSSSPQWKSSIVDEESFHMLSWPTIDTRDTFNTFDLMVKNMRLPEYLGDITNPLYLTVYPRSLGELKPFLDQIKEIVSKNIPFRNLSSQDKQSLINLGKLFRRQFLHPRRGNPTDYHGGISNLRDFFKAYDQGQLVQEEINIGAIVKPALLQEEKIKFLKENPNSVLSKFSHLLGVDKDTYEGFSANENIINDIRKIYPLDKRNEMDITHSESLLAWWVNRNFIKMRQKIENDFYESGFYKSNQVSPLIDCFPIFFFYTDRQTCPSCENIIQSLAYGNYIPLISFSDIFSPDYAFLSGVRIPVQKSAYTLP